LEKSFWKKVFGNILYSKQDSEFFGVLQPKLTKNQNSNEKVEFHSALIWNIQTQFVLSFLVTLQKGVFFWHKV
jgi:hypothetical protein